MSVLSRRSIDGSQYLSILSYEFSTRRTGRSPGDYGRSRWPNCGTERPTSIHKDYTRTRRSRRTSRTRVTDKVFGLPRFLAALCHLHLCDVVCLFSRYIYCTSDKLGKRCFRLEFSSERSCRFDLRESNRRSSKLISCIYLHFYSRRFNTSLHEKSLHYPD
jgi:hypothetical protein